MMPVRYLMFAALVLSIGVGVVTGQSRDQLDPASPAERLIRENGFLPVEDFTNPDSWYQPRRFFNPIMQDPSILPAHVREAAGPGGFIGRSPFVVYDYEASGTPRSNPGAIFNRDDVLEIAPPRFSGQDEYTPVMDLDQYSLQVEFDRPSFVEIRNPDTGATERHWYMIYTVTNPNLYPIHANVDISIRTERQALNADPYAEESGSNVQIQEINEALNREFGIDSLARTIEGAETADILRDIKRRLSQDYIGYTDRYLLSAIGQKEGMFVTDPHSGIRYNQLVPSNYWNRRTRLKPRNDAEHVGYEYPSFVIVDRRDDQPAYRVQPIYNVDGEDSFEITTLAPGSGYAPNGTQTVASASQLASSSIGSTSVAPTFNQPPNLAGLGIEANSDPANATMTLAEAIEQRRGTYAIGDRVDAYGAIINGSGGEAYRNGNPAYERGVLIRSFHDMRRLVGWSWADEGGSYTSGPVRYNMADSSALPTIESRGGSLELVSGTWRDMFMIVDKIEQWAEGSDGNDISDWSAWTQSLSDDLTIAVGALRSGDSSGAAPVRRLVVAALRQYQEDQQAMPRPLARAVEIALLSPSREEFFHVSSEPNSMKPGPLTDDIQLTGEAANGFLWNAEFRPVTCYIKSATARRYSEGDNVIRNYMPPLRPAWSLPGNPNFGNDFHDPYGAQDAIHTHTASGLPLDTHEYEPNRNLRPEPSRHIRVNRFGESVSGSNYIGETYANSIYPPDEDVLDSPVLEEVVNVSSGMSPYFDGRFGRDGSASTGRPVKRVDTFGRTITAGFRYYRVGDRVTPMEWDAYGSMVEINLLRSWANAGHFDREREYLAPGDMLVGKPRLVLTEYRYVQVTADEESPLEGIGTIVGDRFVRPREVVVADEEHWRFGFRCDAFGDYDALVYEDLSDAGKQEFDELLANQLRYENGELERNADKLAQTYLRLVPEMSSRGVARAYTNPLTGDWVLQRNPVLPGEEESMGYVLRGNGDPQYATDFMKLPRYVYEAEYESVSAAEAGEVDMTRLPSEYDLQRFLEESRAAGPRGNLNAGQYWSTDSAPSGPDYLGSLEGQYKTVNVPTIHPAQLNKNWSVMEERGIVTILIDKSAITRIREADAAVPSSGPDPFREFDRVTVSTNAGIEKVTDYSDTISSVTSMELNLHDRNVTYFGRIMQDYGTSIVMEVERELIPEVVHGTVMFGTLDGDTDWRYMNVYVSGLRGRVRRIGLAAVGETMETGTTPQVIREEWIKLLRYERANDAIAANADNVRFVRSYWYQQLQGQTAIPLRELRDEQGR